MRALEKKSWPKNSEVTVRFGATEIHKVRVCASFMRRLVGLLGRGELSPLGGALLWPANSIHTFAMKFAIDVLYLDKTGAVLKAQPNVVPWRASFGPKGSFAVLELSPGAARTIEIGERMQVL